MSPARQIMDTLLVFLCIICVSSMSSNSCSGTKWTRPSCPANNPLMYAGLRKVQGSLLSNTTPTCGPRIYILRLPPQKGHGKSRFPFGPGKWKVRIKKGNCDATEGAQSNCPKTPGEDQGFCRADVEEVSSGTSWITDTTLTFKNVLSTSIEVDLSNVNGTDARVGPVTGFVVEYRQEGLVYFNRTETNVSTISDLKPDTVYEVRWILTSCGLPGEDVLISAISKTRTLCGDIGPVRNLTVTDPGNYGELNVSWESPMKESSNCSVSSYVINYYLVRYRALDVNVSSFTKQSDTSNGRQYVLDGLEDYAIYYISVTYNTAWSDGNNPESPQQTGETIENRPSKVNFTENCKSASSIQVTWGPSYPPKGRILYYNISYILNDDENKTTKRTYETVNTDDPEIIVDLTSLLQHYYFIRIQAWTSAGPGDWSDTINLTEDYCIAKASTLGTTDTLTTKAETTTPTAGGTLTTKAETTTPTTPTARTTRGNLPHVTTDTLTTKTETTTPTTRGNLTHVTTDTLTTEDETTTLTTRVITDTLTTEAETTTPTTRDTPTTREQPVDNVTRIIIICALGAAVISGLPLCFVCFLISAKKRRKIKEEEKARNDANLVNGPSPYMALEGRVGDLSKYMKISDFGPSSYMMYGQGNEDNQLYTGIDIAQREGSSTDDAVPSYDPSGYAGLTPRSSDKDYTKLLSKTEKEVDENDLDENKNTYNDPSGYMGLQNRHKPPDYFELLSKSANGGPSAGSTENGVGNRGGLSTFQSQSPVLQQNGPGSSKDDENSNNIEDLQGAGNGKKQTVVRRQYERNVIQDDMLQPPYFEHIGSDDGRISYFEPIADDEDGNDYTYNASTYSKPATSYETSLQVPANPSIKSEIKRNRTSEGYETASPASYERAIDGKGQPLGKSDIHGKKNPQLIVSSSQNDEVTNRVSTEYFEPIANDDDTTTTDRKEGSYARATKEFYETIPDGLRNSKTNAPAGSKYGRTNYSKSIDTASGQSVKKPGRISYEKSLPPTDLPLKRMSSRTSQSSAYEDAASGHGRRKHSVGRPGDDSKYFPSNTGTMKSNASTEYFEPIADDEEFIDDPETIKNKLENYEMIPEMKKHLRMTEKNSSKLLSSNDVASPTNNNKMSRIPQSRKNTKRTVYETSLTETAGEEKRDPSSGSSAGLTNSAVNRERWLAAMKKASTGYYHKPEGTEDITDKNAGYTSRNYSAAIAGDEEGEAMYETTQHENIETPYSENVVNNRNGTIQKRLEAQQNPTAENKETIEETYAVTDEILDATDPDALYQAIPAYGSFQDSRATESAVLGDIKIKILPRQLWNASSSPEITLSEEFKALPHGQQFDWKAAKAKDDDVDSGILPYDHSRVKFGELSGDSKSDYYNGNYIKDHFNKVNFIAAKVPKKGTTEAYWKMVWDSKTEMVVILASGKSYLPSEKEGRKNVGRFTLTWVSALEDPPEFSIRKLEIKKGNAVQNVKVCHHRVWHETRRLPHPSSVIAFVTKVKSIRRKESVPIIVQCSNGIGATGVFIATYCLVNYLKSGRGSAVSIHEFVRSMRKDRVDMVQTKEEYLLVYETLISAVFAPERPVTVDLLMRMNLIERQDELEQEFETLTRLDKFAVPRSTNAGAHETNVAKNRYPAVLPLDAHRVVLRPLEKSSRGSYINATLFTSTYSKNAFIMAQSPLSSTVEDFWRMIYQFECSTIVSLNEMDPTDESTGGYLPHLGQKRYGKFVVKCINNSENASGLLQQRFSLSHPSSKKKIEVAHYQPLFWPQEESQMAGFIRMMIKLQPVVKTNRTLTVHSLDGASRCGVFVAIATELGNLKNRGDINLFQTAYELKGRSRHVITKYDDYLLCYRVLKGILDAREHDYETLPSEII